MVNVIKDNVKRVMERISDAAIKANRNPDDITLVAVTKTVTDKEAKK